MKARILKALLNNTGYTVHQTMHSQQAHEPWRKVIAIGSPMCSTLITMDMKTFKLRYALDTFNRGRDAIDHEELGFIWDKLESLAETGEIKSIIAGQDELKNPLPVFSYKAGKIVESTTDEYGWPNVTVDGTLMYENVWFKTYAEALKYGLKNAEYAVKDWERNVSRRQEELAEGLAELAKAREQLESFEKLRREMA